jgi:hypothetical protein
MTRPQGDANPKGSIPASSARRRRAARATFQLPIVVLVNDPADQPCEAETDHVTPERSRGYPGRSHNQADRLIACAVSPAQGERNHPRRNRHETGKTTLDPTDVRIGLPGAISLQIYGKVEAGVRAANASKRPRNLGPIPGFSARAASRHLIGGADLGKAPPAKTILSYPEVSSPAPGLPVTPTLWPGTDRSGS